ncbi:MAG: YqgE/AlgH family protein [Zymomonas mobilis subsp. pomaceae]|uniref:UPF0301 protein Zymop_0848 n=1 Tax=Zymomonas mobilis subsp. pomaceae (strain ATCC 29192 / DSM 22645 / JCM 10191 / CCUG 17912 / NBRC 13757 / NCIMB 11200 / NRRL B-4491 / Barker I) TaxID=579138 RepID=F8ESH3_ZYMMT|nr:YqgE/AlgH family protein [Zymomonas mobilis]AEI37748.1 protein of unknown function DUF179 [Zymomonas mobilis subsp. pomaceae ATCC 29192]MDX5949115.1 YqgE/AlgH family protein [Zymomonas mobilis subsp. pomaceae]GEB88922.1 UPF0301 protein [Zymomonas mobilis subsp. pomaceae]
MALYNPVSSDLSGLLLLALPAMRDSEFKEAVIALCAFNREGALGLNISHIVPDVSLHTLMRQLDIKPGLAPDRPVHVGGPCEPQRGMVLHSRDWQTADSMMVGKAWALTSTLDILHALSLGKGPDHWLVALGYSGWGAGQLDREIKQADWFITKAEDHLLFSCSAKDRWIQSYQSAGVDLHRLAVSVGQA